MGERAPATSHGLIIPMIIGRSQGDHESKLSSVLTPTRTGAEKGDEIKGIYPPNISNFSKN